MMHVKTSLLVLISTFFWAQSSNAQTACNLPLALMSGCSAQPTAESETPAPLPVPTSSPLANLPNPSVQGDAEIPVNVYYDDSPYANAGMILLRLGSFNGTDDDILPALQRGREKIDQTLEMVKIYSILQDTVVVTAVGESARFKYKVQGNHLKVSEVRVLISTSQNPDVINLTQNSPLGSLESKIRTDALTAVGFDRSNNTYILQVIFLMDKIFHEDNGDARPDGLVRLAAAAGHEMLGNVPYFLTHPEKANQQPSRVARLESQVYAFSKGVAFLEKIINNLPADNSPAVALARQRYETALKIEKDALVFWQKQQQNLEK